MVAREVEFPFSFERQIAFRGLLVVSECQFGALEGEERSVRWHDGANAVLVGIEPELFRRVGIVLRLRRNAAGRQCGRHQHGGDENVFHK